MPRCPARDRLPMPVNYEMLPRALCAVRYLNRAHTGYCSNVSDHHRAVLTVKELCEEPDRKLRFPDASQIFLTTSAQHFPSSVQAVHSLTPSHRPTMRMCCTNDARSSRFCVENLRTADSSLHRHRGYITRTGAKPNIKRMR